MEDLIRVRCSQKLSGKGRENMLSEETKNTTLGLYKEVSSKHMCESSRPFLENYGFAMDNGQYYIPGTMQIKTYFISIKVLIDN